MTVHPKDVLASRSGHPLLSELLRSLAAHADLKHARQALQEAADAVDRKGRDDDAEIRACLSRANYDDSGIYTLWRGEPLRLDPLAASTVLGAWNKAVAGYMVRKG